jgi:hypothetical protein
MVQGAIGAVVAVVLSLMVSTVWASRGWPGAIVVAPASFFAVMGATFAVTNPRWREKSVSYKLGIVALYGLFGAIVVGGLTALTQS